MKCELFSTYLTLPWYTDHVTLFYSSKIYETKDSHPKMDPPEQKGGTPLQIEPKYLVGKLKKASLGLTEH
jgi:hypothetical protein